MVLHNTSLLIHFDSENIIVLKSTNLFMLIYKKIEQYSLYDYSK
jgi:hypothetical protein